MEMTLIFARFSHAKNARITALFATFSHVRISVGEVRNAKMRALLKRIYRVAFGESSL